MTFNRKSGEWIAATAPKPQQNKAESQRFGDLLRTGMQGRAHDCVAFLAQSVHQPFHTL